MKYTFTVRLPGPVGTNTIETRSVEIPSDEGWPATPDQYVTWMRQNGVLLISEAISRGLLSKAEAIALGLIPPDLPAKKDPTNGGKIVVTKTPGDIVGTRSLIMHKSGQDVVTRSLAYIGQLFAEGFRPLRSDGTPYRIDEFRGGYLLDGSPLNVILGRGWMPGQQEDLAAAVEAGEIPASTLDLDKTFSSGNKTLLYGGLALASVFALPRLFKGKSHA